MVRQLRQAKRPERLAWAYRRLAATVRFLSRVQIVDFDEAAIQRYEQLKNRLQDQQRRQVLENLMKVIYDKETDTRSIILCSGKVAKSDEARPSLIFDYDKAGRLVSLELLDASEQVKAPQSIEFSLSAGG